MAKQFNIIATDVDLQYLGEILSAMGDVDILSGSPSDDLRDLRPLEYLEIPQWSVGKESLFCYLAPRYMPRKIAARRESSVKVHIDLKMAHLIEFWRPYYDTHVIRPGRLYYQNRVPSDGQFVYKDQAFRNWADRVMARVRSALTLHKELSAYVGTHAAAEISSGSLSVVG